MKPVNRYGRAQFYVSFKQLGNRVITTFWFNVSVLWIVSLILYAALYFRVLSRFLVFMGNIRIHRRKAAEQA
jgi:hypothetical protein